MREFNFGLGKDFLELRTLPLTLPDVKREAEGFLNSVNLDLAPLEYCAGLYIDGVLHGLGGYLDNTLMNLAVSPKFRGSGMMSFLLHHLMNNLKEQGKGHMFIYTTPENKEIIKSLGFWVLAEREKFIFGENLFLGIETYCQSLKRQVSLSSGVAIVMNANPFTLGHLYLVEQALKLNKPLRILVVETEKSAFTFAQRLETVIKGTAHLNNVEVLKGGPYVLAAGVFPNYFLKEPGKATLLQAELDHYLFGRYIAPAINCDTRFFGEEPLDLTTAQYVEAAQKILPQFNLEVKSIPRLSANSKFISASLVRQKIKEGKLTDLLNLVPPSTYELILKWQMEGSLKI